MKKFRFILFTLVLTTLVIPASFTYASSVNKIKKNNNSNKVHVVLRGVVSSIDGQTIIITANIKKSKSQTTKISGEKIKREKGLRKSDKQSVTLNIDNKKTNFEPKNNTMSDIKVGSTIMVQGMEKADGTIDVQRIKVLKDKIKSRKILDNRVN